MTEQERKQAFVEGLSKLTQETGIVISGCDGGLYLDPIEIEPDLSEFIYYDIENHGTVYGNTPVSLKHTLCETVERWIARTGKPYQHIRTDVENNMVTYRNLAEPNARIRYVKATDVVAAMKAKT